MLKRRDLARVLVIIRYPRKLPQGAERGGSRPRFAWAWLRESRRNPVPARSHAPPGRTRPSFRA